MKSTVKMEVDKVEKKSSSRRWPFKKSSLINIDYKEQSGRRRPRKQQDGWRRPFKKSSVVDVDRENSRMVDVDRENGRMVDRRCRPLHFSLSTAASGFHHALKVSVWEFSCQFHAKIYCKKILQKMLR